MEAVPFLDRHGVRVWPRLRGGWEGNDGTGRGISRRDTYIGEADAGLCVGGDGGVEGEGRRVS